MTRVDGDESALAAAVRTFPSHPFSWNPNAGNALARAVGLQPWRAEASPRWNVALPMDLLNFGDGRVALNMVVIGTPPSSLRRWTRSFPYTQQVRLEGPPTVPEQATTIVIAIGQFRGDLDLVPRGHPGDGRAEVHTYRLRRAERPKLRRRLQSGTHLPHPEIEQRSVRTIALEFPRPVPLEIDGKPAGTASKLQLSVVSDAYRLLV